MFQLRPPEDWPLPCRQSTSLARLNSEDTCACLPKNFLQTPKNWLDHLPLRISRGHLEEFESARCSKSSVVSSGGSLLVRSACISLESAFVNTPLTNRTGRLATADETRKGHSVFVSDHGRDNVTFAINLPGSPSDDNHDIFYHLTGPIDNSWIGQT